MVFESPNFRSFSNELQLFGSVGSKIEVRRQIQPPRVKRDLRVSPAQNRRRTPPNTLVDYEHYLKIWVEWLGERPIHQITSDDLRDHLARLRTEYRPRRFSGLEEPLAPKTLRNAFITLCAFFTWACKEFGIENPKMAVPAAKFQEPPIEPFSQTQLEALIKVTEFKREVQTDRRKKFAMRWAMRKRDRAIVLFLLDTRLRASELCSLTIGDVDRKMRRVQVRHGVAGGAKGGKGRVVFIGNAARTALWRYLAEREDEGDPDAPLFLARDGCPLNKTAVLAENPIRLHNHLRNLSAGSVESKLAGDEVRNLRSLWMIIRL